VALGLPQVLDGGGGALYFNEIAYVTIAGVTFEGNTASIGGGAVWAACSVYGTLFVGNSTFVGNKVCALRQRASCSPQPTASSRLWWLAGGPSVRGQIDQSRGGCGFLVGAAASWWGLQLPGGGCSFLVDLGGAHACMHQCNRGGSRRFIITSG
jgi:hypothetical protein